MRYNVIYNNKCFFMIKSFKSKNCQELYIEGKSKFYPYELHTRALRKLDILDASNTLEDLKSPPSNRLHSLEDDLKGFYSISINMKWRVIFKFENGEATDVDIVDYH